MLLFFAILKTGVFALALIVTLDLLYAYFALAKLPPTEYLLTKVQSGGRYFVFFWTLFFLVCVFPLPSSIT